MMPRRCRWKLELANFLCWCIPGFRVTYMFLPGRSVPKSTSLGHECRDYVLCWRDRHKPVWRLYGVRWVASPVALDGSYSLVQRYV